MDPRGAPERVLTAHTTMRSRTSRGTVGRPSLGRRDLQVQNRRKPLRCQPMTVAGSTITRAPRQSGQRLEGKTQNQRSDGCSRERGVFRFRTAS